MSREIHVLEEIKHGAAMHSLLTYPAARRDAFSLADTRARLTHYICYAAEIIVVASSDRS